MTKKLISIVLLIAMMATLLTGCGALTAETAPLRSYASTQEVLEYYAKALEYDTVVSRAADPAETTYVLYDVSDATKKEALLKTYATTKELLAKSNYVSTQKSERYLDNSNYNYIRALLNDKELASISGENNVSIKQALGYYFVTEQFTIKPSTYGTFKETISLVGINGAYYESYSGADKIDGSFLTGAVTKLNEYFTENGINSTAAYNNGKFTITNADGSAPIIDYSDTTIEETATTETESSGLGGATTEETTESAGLGGVAEDTETEATGIEETAVASETETTTNPVSEVANETQKSTKGTALKSRSTGIDLDLFTKVVGYGEKSAYIPSLGLIYNIPATTKISGIGLYPAGAFGLSLFGFNRKDLTGTLELTFVYKEDLTGNNNFTLENIYSPYWEVTTGFSANNDNIIPEFLEEEFNVLIDRADRVIVNNDTTGLVNGNVFLDIGMGVLQGYKEQYGNVLRQISTVRRLISRDITNNAYLLEVETFTQEGSSSSDSYGSYKDTNYVVVQQIEEEFIITDWLTMTHQMAVEPDIDPEASTAKRIASLGLTGAVSETTKSHVETLLDNLYTACTTKTLYDKENEDGTVTYGMYDRFDSDTEMLSSTSKEKINSTLRNILVKEGTSTKATMYGVVTEWIGGTDNQVELTTEELVVYEGKGSATYMQCYYLVSCMANEWVIDDLQILDQETLSGDAVNTVLQRLQ